LFANIDVNEMSEEKVLADFRVRQTARSDNPGLCAEEYRRIMDLVIKHIFQWDDENQESTGVGVFGELLAWCLATEEQGRKTLHGHYLLFVKYWNLLWKAIQQQTNDSRMAVTSSEAQRLSLRYFDSVCSATLFHDIGVAKLLRKLKVKYDFCNCKTVCFLKKVNKTTGQIGGRNEEATLQNCH
jgi:hypothetical protein